MYRCRCNTIAQCHLNISIELHSLKNSILRETFKLASQMAIKINSLDVCLCRMGFWSIIPWIQTILYARCFTAYKLKTKIRVAITLYGTVTVLYSKTFLNGPVVCCLLRKKQSNLNCLRIDKNSKKISHFYIDIGGLASIRMPTKNTRKMWPNF